MNRIEAKRMLITKTGFSLRVFRGYDWIWILLMIFRRYKRWKKRRKRRKISNWSLSKLQREQENIHNNPFLTVIESHEQSSLKTKTKMVNNQKVLSLEKERASKRNFKKTKRRIIQTKYPELNKKRLKYKRRKQRANSKVFWNWRIYMRIKAQKRRKNQMKTNWIFTFPRLFNSSLGIQLLQPKR